MRHALVHRHDLPRICKLRRDGVPDDRHRGRDRDRDRRDHLNARLPQPDPEPEQQAGIGPDDIDVAKGRVEVRRQVKLYNGNRAVFALPKGRKTRSVPLPETVRAAIDAHLGRFPGARVERPWGTPDGDPVAVDLIMTPRERTPLNRNYFNTYVWKPALRKAEVPDTRENGCHALRHFYASTLLDAGESIKAVSEYLGHSDAGFTLRTYTHLLPSSDERTRRAVDAVLCVTDV
jgi:integrase